MSSSETTTDHDTIREWIEKRGGIPTVVKGTEGKEADVQKALAPTGPSVGDQQHGKARGLVPVEQVTHLVHKAPRP